MWSFGGWWYVVVCIAGGIFNSPPTFFLIFPYNQRVYKERKREYTPFVSWAMSEDLGAPRRGNLRGWPPSSLSLSPSCLTRAPFFPVFLDRTRRPFKIFSFKQNKASSCLLSPSGTVYTEEERSGWRGSLGIHKTASTLLVVVSTVYTKCTNVKTGPVVGNILKQLKYIPLVNTMRIEKMCV